jgi:hypothetical protein
MRQKQTKQDKTKGLARIFRPRALIRREHLRKRLQIPAQQARPPSIKREISLASPNRREEEQAKSGIESLLLAHLEALGNVLH